jgi:predicted ATPase
MATAASDESADADLVQSKPPFLRRVRIRGYKSIAFCDVELEPLTVLVGVNATGKSNFLDALAFLRDGLGDGLDAALEKHGGVSLFSQELGTNRLGFELESEFPSHEMQCRATYRLDLALNTRKQLEIEREALDLGDVTTGRTCRFTVAKGQVIWQDIELFQEGRWRQSPADPGQPTTETVRWPIYPTLFNPYRPDRLFLGVIGDQPFIDLADGVRSSEFFNFHPDSMREPQPSVGSPALKRDGRNLARAIEGLREINNDDVMRIAAHLRAIVPGVEGFQVIPVADRETILFRVGLSDGRPKREFYASSMSDGTLRALASLVAAFQIILPTGPGIVGIEEPETSLHPGAMRALVAAMDEATLRTQILLTTHSPELLDSPEIRPCNVRVVQMIDGRTVIGPVDEASVSIVRDSLNTLGGLERERQLEPDIEDVERQAKLASQEQNGQ